MRHRNQTLLLFLTALLLVVLLYGCNLPLGDSGGDQIHPPQTKILEVRVQPDTVSPADTASFTCIITDSTDSRFKFYWLIRSGKVEGAKLIDAGYSEYDSGRYRSIKWIAPSKSDTYSFEVIVDNGSTDSVGVERSFSITVKQQ